MRMLPFAATFAVAIFITSFFVDISRPSFRGHRHGFYKMQRLKSENEKLKNENLRLKNELDHRVPALSHAREADEWNGPEVPVEIAPPPPPKPARHLGRHRDR